MLSRTISLNRAQIMGDVLFELARPADRDELAHCIQQTFPGREPMAVALGVPPQEYLSYTELVCDKALEDDLTIVARERSRGEMIGLSWPNETVVFFQARSKVATRKRTS